MKKLRILLWKLRYGWRIFARSVAPDVKFGHYLIVCLGAISDAGWQYAVDSQGGIDAALKESPVEWADEEMSCWTE